MNNKNYKLLDVNMMFFILGIVLLTFGGYVQSVNFDTGIFITEYIIVLMPVVLYGLYKRINIFKALRLNKMKFKTIIKVFFLSIFLIPIIGFGNAIISTILSYFDLMIVYEMPSATNYSELIKYSFLIAISAGICEEIFFRGMILNAYESATNKKFAIIMSAILFGVFHFNPQNLFGPILLGIIFGYLVIVTDSIYSAIIAHTLNNWFAVVAGYLTNKYFPEIYEIENLQAGVNVNDMIVSTISLSVIAIISIIIILLFIKSIKKDCFEVKDNMSLKIDDETYFNVKRKKNGLVLISENLDFRNMSQNEVYDNMVFINNQSLKNSLIIENYETNKLKNINVEIYKFFPLFLSITVYVYYTIAVWKSYGLM
ncbi:type II CAAX endopeptidase family protein [Clostridiaceae bacterium HSG29]|nr:type II CAAX endopeptidase family protein [Clostridiaceae bacterium HSG29]